MGEYLKIVFVLCLLFGINNAQTDYCNLPCGLNKHTVCLRKDVNCGAGPSCYTDFVEVSLTPDDIQLILDTHNSLRNKIAKGEEKQIFLPPATNMKAMKYNHELARIAQCHTNACEFAHDQCRKTSFWSWIGQNVGIVKYKGSPVSYQDALNRTMYGWYNEVADYNSLWLSSFGSYITKAVIGHFTQFVWANSNEIGCGVTLYKDKSDWNCILVACNYGSGGNIIGQPVYIAGPTATLCGKDGVNSKYKGLCGSSN